MEATKATEQRQDSRRQNTRLDERYGEIGISAVAGALHHQGERRNTYVPREMAQDND
jgi:hypothetical protein